MIDPQVWMPEAVSALRRRFGAHVLFVGLQGSYERGDAVEESDIDILTVRGCKKFCVIGQSCYPDYRRIDDGRPQRYTR